MVELQIKKIDTGSMHLLCYTQQQCGCMYRSFGQRIEHTRLLCNRKNHHMLSSTKSKITTKAVNITHRYMCLDTLVILANNWIARIRGITSSSTTSDTELRDLVVFTVIRGSRGDRAIIIGARVTITARDIRDHTSRGCPTSGSVANIGGITWNSWIGACSICNVANIISASICILNSCISQFNMLILNK